MVLLISVISCFSNRFCNILKSNNNMTIDQCQIFDQSIFYVIVPSNNIWFFVSIPSLNGQEHKTISRFCTSCRKYQAISDFRFHRLLLSHEKFIVKTSYVSLINTSVRHTLTPTRRVFRTRFHFISDSITAHYLWMYIIHPSWWYP